MTQKEPLSVRFARGEALDLRGDGKAGGGLVLVVQAFGGALASRGDCDVQDWPLFSSARKGANVRAYLRVARNQVEVACQVQHPDIALLMNEAASDEIDFAEGTMGAVYVINTARSPSEAAARHRLGGTVATVAGDALAVQYLGRPLGNVAAFAALVRAAGLVSAEIARESLHHTLEKRRLPPRLVESNLALFDVALEKVAISEFPVSAGTDHRSAPFAGYGALPTGAQAALRSAKKNRTAGYGRPGVKIEFADPTTKCNGCSLCVAQCPEGIITFNVDPARGAIVSGALFNDYCKGCRECISACPLDLFHEVPAVTLPDQRLDGGA